MTFSQEIYNSGNFLTKIKSKDFLSAKKKLLDSLKNNSFGFLEDLNNKDFLLIKQNVKKLKKYSDILFLGTGGSSLGGKTLVEISDYLYSEKKTPSLHFIENIETNSILRKIRSINLNNTAIVVISKSGETIETISQFFFVKSFYQKSRVSIENKVFVVTEDKQSTLKKIQEANNFNYLEHPRSVGGRFSVFSIVGLLPASLNKFKIEDFCKGGKNFLNIVRKDGNFDNLFFPVLSLCKNHRKINMSILMPYSDALYNLSFWYRQLWGESIGKKRKGITPINALGTVDQHSQLQLYLDGPRDKFFTIIGKKKIDSFQKLDCSYSQKDKYSPLHGKSLQQLFFAEMHATIQTLKVKKLPIRTLFLDDFNEIELGKLMMFFFLETIMGCFILKINPFDQPAVEKGKQLALKYLDEYGTNQRTIR